mmetsp:Transcript_45786/g.92411  ORF Transcript_45786/g.92411 Transcript_45786/m.92411 type:complete len:555 (+) Transcript_45786:13-1677(+)
MSAEIFSLARNNRYDALNKIAANGDLPVEIRDVKGNTLLLVACQNGLKRVARLLLKNGADINAQNHAGNTALHFCYMYGFSETMGPFLLEHGASPHARNHKELLPEKAGSNDPSFLPSVRGVGENPPYIESGIGATSPPAETDTEEYAYDDVADYSNSKDWYTNDGSEWNDQTTESEWIQQTAETQNLDVSLDTPTSVPRGVLRVATTQRDPPPRQMSTLNSPSAAPIVRKAPAGVRRPPPNMPHPDDVARAEAFVAKAASIQNDSVTLAETPVINPGGVRDPGGSAVSAVVFPTTPLGPQMALMEAMISGDYVAMGRSLQVAKESEIHAALLNACARGNEKAVNILLDRAPEVSLTQGCVVGARGGHIGILRLLIDASTDPCGAVNAAIVQGASRGHAGLVGELVERRQAAPEVLRRSMLSAATKNMPQVVKALLPQSVYEDRRAALVACCSNGVMASALVLIGGLPGRFMDQPLAVCASRGNAVLVRHILAGKDSDEIDAEALLHAMNLAQSKEHVTVVEMLKAHLGEINTPAYHAPAPKQQSSHLPEIKAP